MGVVGNEGKKKGAEGHMGHGSEPFKRDHTPSRNLTLQSPNLEQLWE